MPHRSFWVTALGLGSLAAFGCGGGGVSYSGSIQPRLVEPVRLVEADRAPPGLQRLGRISASCSRVAPQGGFEGVRFSDLGCSAALLRAALRERAASAGATYLVELECDPADAQAASGSGGVDCDAEAWGPEQPAAYPAQEPLPVNVDPRGPAAPLAPGWGGVADAWHVLVDYWPAAGVSARASVAPEDVGEIAYARPGYVTLGAVRARADGQRGHDTLHAALLAAAARLGATSLVGVRCVAGQGSEECVASIAALAVPDDTLAAVH